MVLMNLFAGQEQTQSWGHSGGREDGMNWESRIVIYTMKSESHSAVSGVWVFVTPWTIQPMEFSRPEY